MHPGYEYFTRSTDGGVTWPSTTQQIHPEVGSVAINSWWINGYIAIDAGGTLYITWDTQTGARDPRHRHCPHFVQVVGGPAGTAYVAWQANAPAQGWATYLQTFTTAGGLIGSPAQISTAYGTSSVWPGDTFGLATLPNNQIALSWGSANNGSSTSEIYATVVTAGGGIANGGFETGTLSGWTPSGPATGVTTSGPHSGTYAALLGSTSPTNGASSIQKTFTAPTGSW